MTIQEKTAAIKKILANHRDNIAATQGAEVAPGLAPSVTQATTQALMNDLELLFAIEISALTRD